MIRKNKKFNPADPGTTCSSVTSMVLDGNRKADLITVSPNGGGGWADWFAVESSTGAGFSSWVRGAATPQHIRNGGQ